MKMNINKLIQKKGQPIAWCDSHNNKMDSFAIWNFEEEIFLTDSGCYINGDRVDGNPMSILQSCLNDWKRQSENIAAVGFLSYDFKKFLYPHLQFKESKSTVPYYWFGRPREIFHVEPNKIINSIDSYLHPKMDSISFESYNVDLNKIKYHLSAGDVYQINYTYPKLFELDGDPLGLYVKLRQYAQPQFGWYLNLDDFQILSFSPERFFNVHNNKIQTYPIKGTRHRSMDIVRDEQLAGELYNSKKDRAEHLMIVDLLRNDLGKVCEFGTVNVNSLYNIESFETVHHMITEIEGNLKNEIQEMDIISALFPGGSITGAPKERAMQIIDSLEYYSRNLYTGSIGFITSTGEMDFNIAIRTMTIQNQHAVYPVGGGIVWDSVPKDEWNETNIKARILKNVLNGILNKRDLINAG